MNPIQITETLRDSLIRYLLTTFDVNRDGQEPALHAALRDSFNAKGALFNGPFLELTLPYLTGKSLKELATEGVIDKTLLNLDCFREGKPLWPDTPLYLHQESAIRKLCVEERNIIVSSGTGSGKTECFLVPILNDLLKDPTPGVRAVLIYPLNALVNDQLERLRSLLAGTNITFGRYTSELPQKKSDALKTFTASPLPNEVICREEIQVDGKIPQILITNYAMLEYLLLRPADAPLFNDGAWRFIVLDEAHTHAGSQGIEVGLLIRRLRHRLRQEPGDIRCIATSATLTDDKAKDAAEFARALFGVPFSEEDVIFGQVKRDDGGSLSGIHIQPDLYLSQSFVELINTLRQPFPSIVDIALLLEQLGLIGPEKLNEVGKLEDNPHALLWHALRSNRDLQTLKEFMASYGDPIAVEKAAREVFGDRLPENDREQALFHLIELGALARENKDSPPLLPAKYHLFARPPQGIWVCLNPGCPGRHQSGENSWSRIFANRRERCDSCGSAVYPLYVCRTCGQTFVRAEREGPLLLAETDPILDPEPQYFSWQPINENSSLAENESEEDEDIEGEGKRGVNESNFTQIEFRLCLSCQKPAPLCTCMNDKKAHTTLYRVDEKEKSKKGTRNKPVSHMNECPRCRDKALGDTEIATSVSLFSTTPLSILTNELYRLLPGSTHPDISKKPGQGRKLLSFYDSRQGAARFAAFLQDAVNDQIYRHIIPEAVRQLEAEKGRFPDLEEVADRCFGIGWDYHVFHNDPEYSDELGRTRRPSGAQRDRLRLKFMEHAIAELTTRRRGRQSLESLGLLAVEYFESGSEPDFSLLANKIGLNETRTRTLVEYLLDGLRNQKIVVLPDGVMRDSEVFGRNKFSPRLVRSKAQKYEVAWIGETERQFRRQLVKQVLLEERLPNDDETVLIDIFEWLQDNTDLLGGTATEGYQLAYDRIFLTTSSNWYQCERCHRLSPRGAGGLVCPQPNCRGRLSSTDLNTILSDNYYRHIFCRELIPMRVEEHTAQLDSEKGRNYQEEFKRGNINILSCSTTFEMGIDLGDLQGVVLSNVPPTVANYKQRAGRAGRRASGTAFILSWASDRPHDQTHFTSPANIINGQVRVPHLATQNRFILQRHINAILFSAFVRFRKSEGYDDLLRVGSFFDPQVVSQPHYEGLELWFTTKKESVDNLLTSFIRYLDHDKYNIEDWKSQFYSMFRTQGKIHFSEVSEYYIQEVQGASAKIQTTNYSDDLTDTIRRYGRLLDRLRDEYLIDFLSDRGLLPSYSFPLHNVELEIHPDKARGLRLQRDIRQAIREYAPGQEIVADKRIWKSIGLTFYRETPQLFHYRICENCNHLQIGKEAGIPIDGIGELCPLCKEPPSNKRKNIYRYAEPDGFRTGKDSGLPAGQYINREPNLMRSALIPIEPDDVQSFGEQLEAGYSREGKLLYVNEGKFGLGFKLCLKCGTKVANNQLKCTNKYKGESCTGQLEFVTLGFQEVTDTLRLTFHSTPSFSVPSQDDKSFWLSLMYALLQGASQALQIERRDIDGVLFPRQLGNHTWQQTIVLFDNVPGGAGHVRQIREEIIKVIREALRIANCVDCALDSSCYHCLRDYNNQFEHHILARGPVVKFLEGLLASLTTTDDPGQPNPVVALNYPRWLMQTVGRAHQKVVIVPDSIGLKSPSGEIFHWLDVLSNLLKQNVQVALRLTKAFQIALDEPETLSIGRYLQMMIENGLQLDLITTLPEWRLVIDPDSIDSARALKPKKNSFILDDLTGEGGLETITKSSEVAEISRSLEALSGKPIKIDELTPPSNFRILNIENSIGKISEESLFEKIFEHPIIRIQINDRYLYDHYRIVDRLGAYIGMANEQGKLQKVTVFTWEAGASNLRNASRDEQNLAIDRLKSKFPKVNIDFKRGPDVHHDRYLIIERDNGLLARILIGKGLDFIKKDGTAERTFIVIEDPFIPS